MSVKKTETVYALKSKELLLHLNWNFCWSGSTQHELSWQYGFPRLFSYLEQTKGFEARTQERSVDGYKGFDTVVLYSAHISISKQPGTFLALNPTKYQYIQGASLTNDHNVRIDNNFNYRILSKIAVPVLK